jgi:acetylornithine/succinyldiaminopimelate/putrescine aminotransferase
VAVGRGVLAIMSDPENQSAYQSNADRLEHELRSRLTGTSIILHRCGSAFGIDVGNRDVALYTAVDALHRGVLVQAPTTSELVLLPPLTLTTEEAHFAAERLAEALDAANHALNMKGSA